MVTIKQNQTLIPGVISHLAGKATIVPYDFPIENTISAGFSKCWMILERMIFNIISHGKWPIYRWFTD